MSNVRNAFFKDCVADAFFDLMKNKPVNKITVTEIANRAGVGRMTYFRNFKNKMEIVLYKLEQIHTKYYSTLSTQPKTKLENAFALLNCIYSNKEIYLLIHKQCPFMLLVFFLLKTVNDTDTITENKYMGFWFGYGFSGLIYKWCDEKFKETPEEILSIVKKWTIFEN